jgi:hypothetical protein
MIYGGKKVGQQCNDCKLKYDYQAKLLSEEKLVQQVRIALTGRQGCISITHCSSARESRKNEPTVRLALILYNKR